MLLTGRNQRSWESLDDLLESIHEIQARVLGRDLGVHKSAREMQPLEGGREPNVERTVWGELAERSHALGLQDMASELGWKGWMISVQDIPQPDTIGRRWPW